MLLKYFKFKLNFETCPIQASDDGSLLSVIRCPGPMIHRMSAIRCIGWSVMFSPPCFMSYLPPPSDARIVTDAPDRWSIGRLSSDASDAPDRWSIGCLSSDGQWCSHPPASCPIYPHHRMPGSWRMPRIDDPSDVWCIRWSWIHSPCCKGIVMNPNIRYPKIDDALDVWYQIHQTVFNVLNPMSYGACTLANIKCPGRERCSSSHYTYYISNVYTISYALF